MPKSSPEHYSPESLLHAQRTEEGVRKAINETHVAYEHAAAPHLELLAAQGGDDVYPFQSELDAIIRDEDASVAPLVRAQHIFQAKLARLEAEGRVEAEFHELEEAMLTQLRTELDSMRSHFTETRYPNFILRAEEIAAEATRIFTGVPKKKNDAMHLAELLGEFNEICGAVRGEQSRMFAKDIRKSNSEQ